MGFLVGPPAISITVTAQSLTSLFAQSQGGIYYNYVSGVNVPINLTTNSFLLELYLEAKPNRTYTATIGYTTATNSSITTTITSPSSSIKPTVTNQTSVVSASNAQWVMFQTTFDTNNWDYNDRTKNIITLTASDSTGLGFVIYNAALSIDSVVESSAIVPTIAEAPTIAIQAIKNNMDGVVQALYQHPELAQDLLRKIRLQRTAIYYE